MAVQMNIAEAKAKLSELVARAEAGEEVVIACDGVPVVALAHLGPVWEAPDAWDDDNEAARFAEQSLEADLELEEALDVEKT